MLSELEQFVLVAIPSTTFFHDNAVPIFYKLLFIPYPPRRDVQYDQRAAFACFSLQQL